jgi:hypothetical protein
MAERKSATSNLELAYRRHLHYREKHSGWHIFTGVFWGIYLFMMGIIMVTLVPNTLSYTGYFGWGLILLSLFLIIFGFTSSLHLKLMKRYA